MANANLFQQYLQAPKSMDAYSADMDKADSNKLTLVASRLSNQQAQQGMADDASARAASVASGGDQNKLLSLLQSGGNYKAAQALQKSMLDSQKVQADTKMSTSHAAVFDQQAEASKAEQRYKAAEHHAQGLAYVQSPKDIVTYIDQGIAKGVFPPESRDAMMTKANSFASVDEFKKAAGEAAIPVVDKFKVDAENARNALTNQTSRDNNTATNATSRANNASTNATTQRGQNMTDARTRESNSATMGKPFEVTGPEGAPVLVRQDKQGNISRVEGFGPKSGSEKMTEDQGKATGWLVQAENAFGNMKGAMERNPSAAKPGINDAIGAVPGLGGVANSMRGADRQQFMQGASSLSESLLRAATGAGVNKDEAIQKIQELTPVFGEADSTTKQKMAAIPLYIESLKVRAGPGAKKAAAVIGGASASSPGSKAVNFGDLK